MRILGVDYGKKRIGIALSDEAGKFAMPHSVMQNERLIAGKISALAKEKSVTTIVIGESADFGGRENQIMGGVRELVKVLEGEGFTVALEAEHFSSMEAVRFQGATALLDASAAAIILQRYLDTHTQ